MLQVDGVGELQRRLRAVDAVTGRPLLHKVQLDAVANAKRLVPRKTARLARSIQPGGLTDSYAIVRADAAYAAYVELGTKPHVIVPRNKKVLAWPAEAGGRRLSGSARRGAKMAFARKVHHPGTKPHPFLLPGATQSVKDNVGADVIVSAWNRAG